MLIEKCILFEWLLNSEKKYIKSLSLKLMKDDYYRVDLIKKILCLESNNISHK